MVLVQRSLERKEKKSQMKDGEYLCIIDHGGGIMDSEGDSWRSTPFKLGWGKQSEGGLFYKAKVNSQVLKRVISC